MNVESVDAEMHQKETVQQRLATNITSDLEENIFQTSDIGKSTSVEEYFRNIDERVNGKIAAGMKKAVHLLVDKFDILLQNRLNLILSKQVKDEVDRRMRIHKQTKVLCAKCKSLTRRETAAKVKFCCHSATDHLKKSPTAKQIRSKVQERVERSIESHQMRLQSPRARYGNKYPYKSPNRFFESQESSIRSVVDLQYSVETSTANIQSKSPNRHKCSSPIADASFCSSDRVCPYSKKGVPHLEHGHHHHHHLPCGGMIVEKCPRRPKTTRQTGRQNHSKETKKTHSKETKKTHSKDTKKTISKEKNRSKEKTLSKEKETKIKKCKPESAVKPQKQTNQNRPQNRARNSVAAAAKTTRQVETNLAKRQRELKIKRTASKASVGESLPRQPAAKKCNDALKLKQDEYVEKLPIGYPMELKEDLIDTRLKWLNNTQQVSALFDEIDDIYKEMDPIEESIELRKKHNGFINNYSVVRSKKKEKRKFFFYLRSKLPEQNSIFEVSPTQTLNQIGLQQRGDAIRVFDDSDRTNPNIMVPQSSNSSSRVKISGSQSTQKIDRSGNNSDTTDQNITVNQEDTQDDNQDDNQDYRPPISSSHAKQTYTDSRKYSDSEHLDKLPSGQPEKRKPDQIFKAAFLSDKKYQAKSIPCSPAHASKASLKVMDRTSPDKWVVLDQSSQEALKDLKLAHSFQKTADGQVLVDQNLLSQTMQSQQLASPKSPKVVNEESQVLKQQEEEQEQKQEQELAPKGPEDDMGMAAPGSPNIEHMQAVYSPEKHPQMLHALVQQQSPEKIHFETFEKLPEKADEASSGSAAGLAAAYQSDEPHMIQFQMCAMMQPEMTVQSPKIGPDSEQQMPLVPQANDLTDDDKVPEPSGQVNILQIENSSLPNSPRRNTSNKGEMISESLPESPQQPPHHMNELKELERDIAFPFHSQDFSMDISHDRVEQHTPVQSLILRSQLMNQAPPSVSPLKPAKSEQAVNNSNGEVRQSSEKEEVDKKLQEAEEKELELSRNLQDSRHIKNPPSRRDRSPERHDQSMMQSSAKHSEEQSNKSQMVSPKRRKQSGKKNSQQFLQMMTTKDLLTQNDLSSSQRLGTFESKQQSTTQIVDQIDPSLSQGLQQITSHQITQIESNPSQQSQHLQYSLDQQVQILNADHSVFGRYPEQEGMQDDRIVNVQAEDTEVAEDQDGDLTSQMSKRIDISELDIADQTKYIEELQKIQTTKQRDRARSKDSVETVPNGVEENAGHAGDSQQPRPVGAPQHASSSTLNTITALERVLNQVKSKHVVHNGGVTQAKSISTNDNTCAAQDNQTTTFSNPHHQTQPSSKLQNSISKLQTSIPQLMSSPKANKNLNREQQPAAPPPGLSSLLPNSPVQEPIEETTSECPEPLAPTAVEQEDIELEHPESAKGEDLERTNEVEVEQQQHQQLQQEEQDAREEPAKDVTADQIDDDHEGEDLQLKRMMEQFVEEVVVENSADGGQEKPRQHSQTQVATRFINEIEIDKAINEVLEGSSFNFNKNDVRTNEASRRSAFDLSLPANKTQPEKSLRGQGGASNASYPFRLDQIEEIKLVKAMNDGPSSGIQSMYHELEKAKLLMGTSPRKANGEHHIEFEQQQQSEEQSIPENRRTSPRQYQNDNMGIVENLLKIVKPHTRQATALVGGHARPVGLESSTNLRRGVDTTQKTSENLTTNADLLQILYKNSFVRDFDLENILKLAAELQKVTYKKNEQIVRFGDISQNYYILHKGKIKVTEYEPSTSPHDPDLENKITVVKYINKEGYGFGDESVKNFTPLKASIDAIEQCEFYVLDGFFINELLTKVSQAQSSMKDTKRREIQLIRTDKELNPTSNPITISDDQQRTDSGAQLRFDMLQPDMNFMPESFLTESQSSRHRIRAASYCPCKVYHHQHHHHDKPESSEKQKSDGLLNCDLSAIRQKDQPSISASSSSISQSLRDLTYASFIENMETFGLNFRELTIFGDRAPPGHQKVRVLSKGLSYLQWLTTSRQGSQAPTFYISTQIPRALGNFQQRVKMLQVEQEFFNTIKARKDIMRNVFAFDSTLQKDSNKDLWQFYRTDQRKDVYKSLYDSLFDVTFDQRVAMSKMVDVQHSTFYNLLVQKKGLRHLAKIIRKVCDFLLLLHDQGIVYGNLRSENILIRLDDEKKEIQQIKFMDFGSTAKMERASEMLVPDKIEHCPPDLLKNLMEIEKFQKSQHKLIPEHLRTCKRRINEISESIDVYSLGVLLLQIIVGCPLQQQVPLRFKYKTIKGQQFISQPMFGTIPQKVYLNNMDVKHLVTIQENFAGNMGFYMQKNDQYKLTQDHDFMRLLQSMLHKDHNKRPTVRAILSDRFVKKWVKAS